MPQDVPFFLKWFHTVRNKTETKANSGASEQPPVNGSDVPAAPAENTGGPIKVPSEAHPSNADTAAQKNHALGANN